MRKVLFLTIILHLLILSTSSCAGGSDSSGNQNSSLEVNLSLKNGTGQESTAYSQGENIEFVLTVANTSSTPVKFNFTSSQQFDFHIINSSDVEVWRWSEGKMFLTVLTELHIGSQETVAVNRVWDQTIEGGNNIEAGNYTAIGSFLDQSPEARFEFSIQ